MLALDLLIACLPPPALLPQDTPPADTFEASLAEVAGRFRAQDWAGVNKELDALLGAHEDSLHAFVHRPQLEEHAHWAVGTGASLPAWSRSSRGASSATPPPRGTS